MSQAWSNLRFARELLLNLSQITTPCMAGLGRGIHCPGCWEMELKIPLFLLGFLQVSQALAEFCAVKNSSGRCSRVLVWLRLQGRALPRLLRW